MKVTLLFSLICLFILANGCSGSNDKSVTDKKESIKDLQTQTEKKTIDTITVEDTVIKDHKLKTENKKKTKPVKYSTAKGKWLKNIRVNGRYKAFSGIKNATTHLNVYLPKGYSEKVRFPWVLLLHGWNGKKEEWLTKAKNLTEYADKHHFVLVCPDMGTTIYESEYYPFTKRKWSTIPGLYFVDKVILPYVKRNYSIIEDRKGSGVLGYSTGGRGAVLLAEKYGEFSAVVGLSGTYNLFTLPVGTGEYKIHRNIFGKRVQNTEAWKKDDCSNPDLMKNLDDTSLLLIHGEKDPVVSSIQSSKFASTLKKQYNHDVKLIVDMDGKHDWKFWNKHLKQSFKFLTEHLKKPEPK